MKALFIGGTGTISAAIVRRLAQDPLWEVWLLNRGNRTDAVPEGVHVIQADVHQEEETAKKLEGMSFDTVCDFIAFVREDVERDVRLFRGKTRQYMFISSASAYHKPAASYVITEGTTLANPHWLYSRNKIACEEYLMKEYRETGFPITIIRPSHTYDERNLPMGVDGKYGSWPVVKRMLEGKPVIINGDGTSLWTVTFNTDFAVAFTGLMANRHAIGEAFQITGDEVLTWNQIYQTIADALGVELHAYHVASDFLAEVGAKYGYDYEGSLVGDKSVSVMFDNRKLKRAVPWMRTEVPFHRGARITLDNMLKHPELQKDDPEFDGFCDRIIAALEKAKQDV